MYGIQIFNLYYFNFLHLCYCFKIMYTKVFKVLTWNIIYIYLQLLSLTFMKICIFHQANYKIMEINLDTEFLITLTSKILFITVL
jgi:hypothetical protein